MKNILLAAVAALWFANLQAQVPFVPNISGFNTITSSPGGPSLVTNGGFGSAVARIGDLNNDGIEDLAVGAAFDDDGGGSSDDYGAIYICFMDTTKAVKSWVKIYHSTSGFSTLLAKGDNFGKSICGVGDLNGDGDEDIMVGAPGTDITSFSNSGAVYVLFLDSLANVLSYKKIVKGINGGPAFIKASSAFGQSLCLIGDINHDGVPDVAAGGLNHSEGTGSQHGAVWTLRMKTDGTVKYSTTITNSSGWLGTLASGDHFGTAIAGTGDLNNDRNNDLLISAPEDDGYLTNNGAVYLLYLDTSGSAVSYKKYIQPFANNIVEYSSSSGFGVGLCTADLNADGQPEFIVGANTENGFLVLVTDTAENVLTVKKYMGHTNGKVHWNNSLISGIQLGTALTSIGDLDNDGITELVAGANGYDSPLANNGAIFVLDMEEDFSAVNLGDVLDYNKYGELSNTIATLAVDDFFGSAVCDLGDVNADGYNDVAIGAYGDNTGGTDRGAVYIVFLDSLQRKISVQKIASGTGGFGTGLDNGDGFGYSATGPGDLDGDNIPDLVVGAYHDDDGVSGAADRGCIWVVYLNSNGTVKAKHKISDTRGGFTGTFTNSCEFGTGVAAIGDINNDGINDLAVGMARDDDGATDNGAVWILFMNAADSVSSYQKISDTQGNFTETFSGTDVLFGRSVAAGGDMNDDGKEDIVVGSPAMNATGAAYVLFLDTLGQVSSFKKINNAASNFPETLQSGKNFGSSVGVLNDIDGNGYKEILIGNSGYTSFGNDKGAVWIAFTDSASNVLWTTKNSEESPYFNSTLRASDLFGGSVCHYLAKDGSSRIFSGANNAQENSSQEGAVFSWHPMGLDSMTMRKLAFGTTVIVPGPDLDRWPRAYKGYYDLNRTIDGGMYYPTGSYLYFKYYEEYRPGDMHYNIYHSNNEVPVVITSTNKSNALCNMSSTSTSASVPTKNRGQNYFRIDCITLGIASGYYTLETVNDKGETMYLRFKYVAPIVSPVPGGGLIVH